MKKRLKYVFSIIAIVPVAAMAILFFGQNNFRILETSVLSILKNVAEQNAPEPPELGIDKITVRKVSDPTDSFRYYTYRATMIIHNYGGNLVDGRLIIHTGENQKHSLVRNTDAGFSLDRDGSYVVRDFEFLVDGKYNYAKVPISIELVDRTDYFEENNSYFVEVFDDNAKIDALEIDEILDDGTIALSFNSIPFSIRTHNFEVMTSDSAKYEEGDLRYKEAYAFEKDYGYFKFKNSEENLKESFVSESKSELESHFLEFPFDPFLDEGTHYVYIKATNPENGDFAVSNVLMLPAQETMDRAKFSKLFLDSVGEKTISDGVVYFEDVDENEWYFPYVQTLYNLGLLDMDSTRFNPDEVMSRGEVLKIVMDYFDVDLLIPDGAPHFEDVEETDPIYPYVESLLEWKGASAFSDYFNPDQPATTNYLRFLVNEHGKNN